MDPPTNQSTTIDSSICESEIDSVFNMEQLVHYLDTTISLRKKSFMLPFKQLSTSKIQSVAEIEKQTQHESELLNKIQKDRSKSESALTGLINENCAFYKLKLARDSDGFFGGKYAENAAALVECEREHKKMLELIKFESRVMFMNKKEIDRVADVCDAEFDRRMKEQTQGINVSK